MPSRKKRRQSPVNIPGVLLLIAVVIAFCSYVFYFISPPVEEDTSAPPPADQHTSISVPPGKPVPTMVDFSSLCRQTTRRIQQFCRNEGVSPAGFQLLNQHSIEQDGKRWLFTKATIVFPRDIDPLYIASELGNALGDDGTLSFQWKKRGSDSCDLLISTHQVLTHMLTIVIRFSCLAIIIDDVGNDLQTAKKLLDLGIPLTLSILPNLPYSKEAESLAHERGYEVMLHLPMEPRSVPSYPLGKDAILHDMNRDQVTQVVSTCLKRFPHAKGVNNHMGSLVTEDERIMSWVMEAIAPHDLYFIDSRTSSQSVAFQVAHDMGIPAAKNYIFIDNEPEIASCKDVVDKAIRHVKEEGTSIAIGHARPTTVQALREVKARIQDNGIRLVFVSELLSLTEQ